MHPRHTDVNFHSFAESFFKLLHNLWQQTARCLKREKKRKKKSVYQLLTALRKQQMQVLRPPCYKAGGKAEDPSLPSAHQSVLRRLRSWYLLFTCLSQPERFQTQPWLRVCFLLCFSTLWLSHQLSVPCRSCSGPYLLLPEVPQHLASPLASWWWLLIEQGPCWASSSDGQLPFTENSACEKQFNQLKWVYIRGLALP